MQGTAPDSSRPLACIVDDDADTRELYRLVLESAGYRVEDAGDVSAARALFSRLDPSVVLTDWLLPDGSGLDVCDALRARSATRHVPVLAVTGLAFDQELKQTARERGCVELFEKPVEPERILEAAAAALTTHTERRVRAAAERARRYARCLHQADRVEPIVDRAAARSGQAISILIADDRAHYVAAGGAVHDLIGYEPREMAALSIWDLTPDSHRPASQGLWQQFLASGKHGGQYELRRRDGRTILAQYYAIPNIAPGLHVSALAEAQTSSVLTTL